MVVSTDRLYPLRLGYKFFLKTNRFYLNNVDTLGYCDLKNILCKFYAQISSRVIVMTVLTLFIIILHIGQFVANAQQPNI